MTKQPLLWLILAILLQARPAVGERNLTRPPGTTRYAPMVSELSGFAQYDRSAGYHRMSLATVGRSVDGRGIWMAVLHDPNARDPGKKVFYLCRQHGHEPASTEAALRFIDELVHAAPGSDLAQCLARTTLYIVPMANPDGAEAYRRHNAHDVDMNRDWLARTQPETRALWAAIERIRPDLMTDQHEMFPDDPRPDFTETVGPAAAGPLHPPVAQTQRGIREGRPNEEEAAAEKLPPAGTTPDVMLRGTIDPAPDLDAVPGSDRWRSVVRTSMETARLVHLCLLAKGVGIRCHWLDDDHPPKLAHRYESLVAGVPAILFETNRHSLSRTVAMRAAVHLAFMEIILRNEAGEHHRLAAEAARTLGLPS